MYGSPKMMWLEAVGTGYHDVLRATHRHVLDAGLDEACVVGNGFYMAGELVQEDGALVAVFGEAGQEGLENVRRSLLGLDSVSAVYERSFV